MSGLLVFTQKGWGIYQKITGLPQKSDLFCGWIYGSLALFDAGVGVVGVDALEVFNLHFVPGHVWMGV